MYDMVANMLDLDIHTYHQLMSAWEMASNRLFVLVCCSSITLVVWVFGKITPILVLSTFLIVDLWEISTYSRSYIHKGQQVFLGTLVLQCFVNLSLIYFLFSLHKKIT